MKRLLLLIGLVLIPLEAFGQTTVVSGTVTDSSNTPYAFGTYTVSFINTSGQQPTFGGNPNFQQTYSGASLDTNGSFSITLPSNTAISPSPGTQWAFNFCANPKSYQAVFPQPANPVCFNTGGISITGTSQSITTQITAAVVTIPKVSGGSSSTSSPNQQKFYLVPQSQGCGGVTNCATIFGDGKLINDGTSNSTTTFTCPNSDCNFTSADVGKTFWATTQGTQAGGTFNNTTYVCPVTTIASLNSSQSINLNLACTASGTANAVAIWGHRDGTALHALDGSAVGCVNIEPFSGATILFDQAEFITPPTCSGSLQTVTGYPQKDWIPVGNTTNLVMTPDFNWATCTGHGSANSGNNVCIGSGLNELDNTGIWGTGLTPAANANCANGSGKTILLLNPSNAAMKNTNVSGICPGETGEGVELAAFDEFWTGGGAQYAMTQNCVISGQGVWTSVLDCRSDGIPSTFGYTVVSGGIGLDISTFPIVGLRVMSGGTFQSRGTHFCGVDRTGFGGGSVAGMQVDSGSIYFSYGDFVNTDAVCSQTGSTVGASLNGAMTSTNTIFKASPTGSAIQFGTTSFTSNGGNTVTGGAISYFTGNTENGWDVLQGSCTGVVASASTIGLFQLGNNTTTTCTSTTTNIGPVVGKAGTIVGFGCFAGTAGNQAADACTVMKNNVATSLTCSLNGATFCGDGAAAHQTAYAQGDIITVKVVSGTSTTLANVKASVLAW